MPQQCSDVYGPGWTGNYPNCQYSPSDIAVGTHGIPDPSQANPFTGTIQSLGFDELLPQGAWGKYFDTYDPTEEYMLMDQADRQLGDLQTAWDLRGRGLRDETGSAYERAFGLGEQGAKKSGMAFSGTIAEQARKARSQVGQGYQSMMGEQLADLFSRKTNIYSGLQSGIFGLRRGWEDEQRANLNALLGSDIWGNNTSGSGTQDRNTFVACCDGTFQPTPQDCGEGNMPHQCGGIDPGPGGSDPGGDAGDVGIIPSSGP
jgi:hypothetical protein